MKQVMGIVLVSVGLIGCVAPPPPKESRPVVLRFPAPPKPPEVAPRQNVPLDAALRARAREQIAASARSSDTVTRCQAIEAAQNGLGMEGTEIILAGLDDPKPLVRFAAALAAGGLRLEPARPKLIVLAEDADPNVRIAVRYGLHRLGDYSRSHDLEQLSVFPDPYVRRNVVMVLGLLGEKSAVRILWPMQRDSDGAVRIQVAEALWRLGNESGLNNLAALVVSEAPDDQIIAVLALASAGDSRVRGYPRGKLTTPYDEVNLAAARALGMLGSDEGYGVAMKGVRSSDGRQRGLAALALGAIGRADAQPALSALLDDKEESVRLAASLAVLQLKAD